MPCTGVHAFVNHLHGLALTVNSDNQLLLGWARLLPWNAHLACCMQNVAELKLDSKTLRLLQGVNSAASSESRVVRAQQLQSLLQRSETNAAATAEHLPAGMPAPTATAWIGASVAPAAAPTAGLTPSRGVPPTVLPVKSVPFDLMGPSLLLNAQIESACQPIAPQLKSRTDMPQVSASGLPDQMSRHGLPEGIVFVGHNNLGLATNEELTRAAVNGTLLDGDSMEPTRYPWLTGKYTGEQSFSLGSQLQSQAEGLGFSATPFCVQEPVQGLLPNLETGKALSPTPTPSQMILQAVISGMIPNPVVVKALGHNPNQCCVVGQAIAQEWVPKTVVSKALGSDPVPTQLLSPGMVLSVAHMVLAGLGTRRPVKQAQPTPALTLCKPSPSPPDSAV